MEALDGTIGPRMGRLGQAMRHAKRAATTGKAMPAWNPLVRRQGELYDVVGQHVVPLVSSFFQHPPQNVCGHHPRGARVQLGEGSLAGAVDGHKALLAAFFWAHLRKINVQLPNRVIVTFFLRRSLSVVMEGQPTHPVALKTAMQRRA